MKWILTIVLLGWATLGISQRPAYLMYNAKGKSSNYDKMMKSVAQADIVLFGEYHNNTISHWLELELAQDIFGLNREMAVGCEMFEADDQHWLDLYVDGGITLDSLAKSARVWPNYKTDYQPVFAFFEGLNVPLVATNVPRKYAKIVSRGGFEALDTLPEIEKGWMCPLPIEPDYDLPGYKNMIDMMAGHSGGLDPKNFVNAQALKDATMAYFILKDYHPGEIFYHFNGAYHSDNHEGIVWWLRKQRPDLKIVTITTREYENISRFQSDDTDAADFIIYVPENMTHTY